MGFFGSRISFARFRPTGTRPPAFGEDSLANLEKHKIGNGRAAVASADGIDSGWIAGDHILDRKFDLAKNELALREKSFELIIERLRKTEVMAPFDSTILTRPISVGQAVSGSGGFNAGTEVLTIANLNDLIVNAHINQADVTRLHVDQQVEVSVEAVSGLKVVGKVERIAPQSTLKNNIRGFAARILLKDVGNQIRPGMSANISIPVASADNVVAAPLASVFTETNPATREIERHVWVRKEESWERRPVKIGVSDYFFAEVTSGLQAGEVVSLEDRTKEMGTGGATNGVKVAVQSPAAQR